MHCPTISELPNPPDGKTGWPWTAESTSLMINGQTSSELPKISIITPSFNQGSFLEAAIRSVLLQGYPNLEYIVMDGGSSDKSIDILRKYDKWIFHWESKPDNGQYYAIGKGFKISTGHVLAWLNSDDMYTMDALSTVGSIFSFFDNKVHWLTGLSGGWAESGELRKIASPKCYRRYWIMKGLCEGRALGWIQQEVTFWTRDLWEKSGKHMDEKLIYAGDYDLWQRFAKHCKLYSTTLLLGGYRSHPNRKTSHSLQLYFNEVDQLLCKLGCLARYMNILCRIRMIQLISLIFLKLVRPRNLIIYDLNKTSWTIK